MNSQEDLSAPPLLLVVDDDKSFLDELCEGLINAGIACISATTITDAINRFRDHPTVDVALIDIHLQGGNGIDLLEKLQHWRADRRVEGIMLTGGSTVENAVRSLRIRAADFLQKPVSPLEVKRVVDRIRLTTTMPAPKPQEYLADLSRAALLKVAIGAASNRHVIAKDMAEGAWLILVEANLFLIEGKALHVTSACMASGAPLSTAVRYINELESRGFLERVADHRDGRRTVLRITETGILLVESYLKRLRKKLGTINNDYFEAS